MKKDKRGLQKHLDCQSRIWPLREEIERLYVDGDLSQRECGKIFGVSQGMFGRWLKMLGLPAKGKANCGKQNGRYINGYYCDGPGARPYLKLVVRRKCSACDTVDGFLLVHHKDENRLNNEIENLQVMCRSCHLSHHKILYWQRWREKHGN